MSFLTFSGIHILLRYGGKGSGKGAKGKGGKGKTGQQSQY